MNNINDIPLVIPVGEVSDPFTVAVVVSAHNLDATCYATNGLYSDNKPASITWTLSDV